MNETPEFPARGIGWPDARPTASRRVETVRSVSTLLEAVGRASGQPIPLAGNSGVSFIGCYLLGMGFVVTPADAYRWIIDDPRNADVLFPYLTGDDLNSRPDLSASRWA